MPVTRVQESVDALPRGQLAAGLVALNLDLATTLADPLERELQLLHEEAHVVLVSTERLVRGIDCGFQGGDGGAFDEGLYGCLFPSVWSDRHSC